MRIFLIVIAIVVLFPFLRNCWKAFFHPATILGNQAAKMNWIIDGREKDGIVNNMRYRRGNLIAVIPFNNPSVLLRYGGTEKRFRDFIEVERWIGKEIGIRDLEIDQRVDQKEIRKKELEVEQLSAQLDEEASFRKLELGVEQLCIQLDEAARISEKELEIDQRVNQKIEKFANYDFENAGDDISKNEIEAVFDNLRKSIEVIEESGDFSDLVLRDIGKRCGLSLGAVLHYHNSQKYYDNDPEEIYVAFSYAMHMIYEGFYNYVFDEKKTWKENQNIPNIFRALVESAMISSAGYILDKDFKNSFSYFQYYFKYEPMLPEVASFWEKKPYLIEEILSVRKLLPKSKERSFIYGYDFPEVPDVDEEGNAELEFTDYAFVNERILSNPKFWIHSAIDFLKDTKFLYTPIYVRFFFKPDIDK